MIFVMCIGKLSDVLLVFEKQMVCLICFLRYLLKFSQMCWRNNIASYYKCDGKPGKPVGVKATVKKEKTNQYKQTNSAYRMYININIFSFKNLCMFLDFSHTIRKR